jgi:hypothetical protein
MRIRSEQNGKIGINAKNYLTVGPGDYACGDNLYLIVAPSGGRRWLKCTTQLNGHFSRYFQRHRWV